MSPALRFLIGIIITLTLAYYHKTIYQKVTEAIEISEEYDYESDYDDEDEDNYAYDDYDTDYDW